MLIITVRDNENIRRKRNGKQNEKNKVIMPAIVKGGEQKSNLELVLSIMLKERELCIREFVYQQIFQGQQPKENPWVLHQFGCKIYW